MDARPAACIQGKPGTAQAREGAERAAGKAAGLKAGGASTCTSRLSSPGVPGTAEAAEVCRGKPFEQPAEPSIPKGDKGTAYPDWFSKMQRLHENLAAATQTRPLTLTGPGLLAPKALTASASPLAEAAASWPRMSPYADVTLWSCPTSSWFCASNAALPVGPACGAGTLPEVRLPKPGDHQPPRRAGNSSLFQAQQQRRFPQASGPH